MRLVDRKKVK